MSVQYIVGDTRTVTATIPDGSVDLIASSPPFLALRSYVPADHASKGDEIGSEANPAAFIDMLLGLTAEWGRVLAPHGSIAIELGDTYSGSGGAGGDYNEGGLRADAPKFTGSAMSYRKSAERNRDLHAWPYAKSLALIPQLYAVALAYGINPLTGQPSPAGRFLVRNVIVWHRPNPAVGALGDKVRPSTSYIVIATRSAKRWFDLTAVRTASDYDRPNLRGLGSRLNGSPPGQSHNASDHTVNAAGAAPLDCWTDAYDGNHHTWTLTTQPSKLAHYAMWPAKLAERLVLMMCPLAVCRVCGEPRRRMETVSYEGTTTRRATSKATASVLTGVSQGHHAHRETNPLRSVTGEHWTDCGHAIEHRISPDRVVLGETFRPGLVLDPFAGSGTTLAVADLHGRDATGIDFDARNKAIYPARYDEVKRALYGTPAPMPGQMELAL